MATATFSFFKGGNTTARPAVTARKRTVTVSGTARKRKTTATISASTFGRLTVIQQIKRAFLPGARLAAFVGVLLGGLIPLCTWVTAHFEVQAHPYHWVFVGGGLLYSAQTVFQWSRDAFGAWAKALGFVVLLEGTLTFCTILPLSIAALGVLIFVNAVAAACALQVRKETPATPARSSSHLTTLWGER